MSQSRKDARHEIKREKTRPGHSVLDGAPEHPQKEHIESHMPNPAGIVKKLIGNELPPLDVLSIEMPRGDKAVEVIQVVVMPHHAEQVHQQIGDDQEFRDHWSSLGLTICSQGNEHCRIV